MHLTPCVVAEDTADVEKAELREYEVAPDGQKSQYSIDHTIDPAQMQAILEHKVLGIPI